MIQYFSGKKKTLCLVPDYSTKLTITNNSILEDDVYAEYTWVSANGNWGYFYIDNEVVSVGDSSSNIVISTFSGFIPKGSKVNWDGGSIKFFKVA